MRLKNDIGTLLSTFFHSLYTQNTKATLACMSDHFRARVLTDENVAKYKKVLDSTVYASSIHVALMLVIAPDTVDCTVSCQMSSNYVSQERLFDFYIVFVNGQWVIDNIVLLKTRNIAL